MIEAVLARLKNAESRRKAWTTSAGERVAVSAPKSARVVVDPCRAGQNNSKSVDTKGIPESAL